MFTETDVRLGDGRTLHVYDTGTHSGTDAGRERLVVVYHHGSPNIGEPPAPLFPASAERGIRWVSYDRPGYGGSTPNPGRDMASAAADVAGIADALGLDRFAVMGHSGGSAHAWSSPHSCRTGCSPRSACPGSLRSNRSAPTGSTGSTASARPARRSCALPPEGAQR